MACFTCGKNFGDREKDVLKLYKKEYEDKGVERYVYKTCGNCAIKFTKKEYFNVIFEGEIKPNLEKGAEYFHISEYSGT